MVWLLRCFFYVCLYFFFFIFNKLNESQAHVIFAIVTNTDSVPLSKTWGTMMEIFTGIDWIPTTDGRTNLVRPKQVRQITKRSQSSIQDVVTEVYINLLVSCSQIHTTRMC